MATLCSVVSALFIGSPSTRSDKDKNVAGVTYKRLPKAPKHKESIDETRFATRDKDMMMGFFKDRGILPANLRAVIYELQRKGKEPIVQEIEKFFAQPGTTHFILSYSGHGYEGTGGWFFQVEGPKKGEQITLQDIVRMWDNAMTGNQGQRYLMIISDSCHSGELVKQVNEMPRHDIYIQAACRAKEQSEWTGTTFTSKFICAAHTGNTGKTLLNTLLFDIPRIFKALKYWRFTPISSRYTPSGFGGIAFFDSFADM